MKNALFFSLILILFTSSLAQKKKPLAKRTTSQSIVNLESKPLPTEKGIHVIEKEISDFSNSFDFKVNYDRFDNLTRVFFYTTSAYVLRYEPNVRDIKLAAGFNFKGNSFQNSIDQFWFGFVAKTDRLTFYGNSRLQIIADRQRFDLGRGRVSVKAADKGGMFDETIEFLVSRKILLSIASAKVVDMRLGNSEISLSPTDLDYKFSRLLKLATNNKQAKNKRIEKR